MTRYCCERCKVAPERKGFEDEVDQESVAVLRIAEVSTNFGVLWVLCINCRRDWLRFLNSCKSMREYSEYGFRLEHFRTAHRKTGLEDVERGFSFIKKLNDLDEKLFAEAQEWLEKGVTADDWKRRGGNPPTKPMISRPNKGDYGYRDEDSGDY